MTSVKNSLDSFCVDVVILTFTQMYCTVYMSDINTVIPQKFALHPLIFNNIHFFIYYSFTL